MKKLILTFASIYYVVIMVIIIIHISVKDVPAFESLLTELDAMWILGLPGLVSIVISFFVFKKTKTLKRITLVLIGILAYLQIMAFILGFNISIATTGEILRWLSSSFIFASGLVYIIALFKGDIRPVFFTWSIFMIVAWAVLATVAFSDSPNLTPIIVSVICPTIITVMIFRKRDKEEKVLKMHKAALWVAGSAIVAFILLSMFGGEKYALFALSLSLGAEVLAVIPSSIKAFKKPEEDKPGAWLLFGIGFMILLASPEKSLADIITAWTLIGCGASVWIPLSLYRIKNKLPLKEWI